MAVVKGFTVNQFDRRFLKALEKAVPISELYYLADAIVFLWKWRKVSECKKNCVTETLTLMFKGEYYGDNIDEIIAVINEG